MYAAVVLYMEAKFRTISVLFVHLFQFINFFIKKFIGIRYSFLDVICAGKAMALLVEKALEQMH